MASDGEAKIRINVNLESPDQEEDCGHSFNLDPLKSSYGVICILSTLYYMVDGTVRADDSFRYFGFTLDTGKGFNFIRMKLLPFWLGVEL